MAKFWQKYERKNVLKGQIKDSRNKYLDSSENNSAYLVDADKT